MGVYMSKNFFSTKNPLRCILNTLCTLLYIYYKLIIIVFKKDYVPFS